MFKSMLCKMCLTEITENTFSICDSCKAILLNVNMNMDGKLKDFLLIQIK